MVLKKFDTHIDCYEEYNKYAFGYYNYGRIERYFSQSQSLLKIRGLSHKNFVLIPYRGKLFESDGANDFYDYPIRSTIHGDRLSRLLVEKVDERVPIDTYGFEIYYMYFEVWDVVRREDNKPTSYKLFENKSLIATVAKVLIKDKVDYIVVNVEGYDDTIQDTRFLASY